jgi:hypothetical protein
MWVKDARLIGKKNWDDAMATCGTFSLSGTDDWRLPSQDELVALYEATQCEHPFIGDQSSYYWSSTPYERFTGFACGVEMNSGVVHANCKISYTGLVWPVRAGQ